MSDSTFEQLWRRILVYYPECPLPLAQEFVNTAYSRALSSMKWSGVKGSGEFFIPAPFSGGTLSLTQGVANVVGNAGTFTSSLIGKQLVHAGGAPFYTIIDVVTPILLTLDRVWGDVDHEAIDDWSIQSVYVTVPSDFSSFRSVVDLDNNWKLHTNFTSEDLDAFDAQRTHSANTFVLAGTTPNPVNGRPRFELYPRPTGPKSYSYTYNKKPALMRAASDAPVFPIRGDVLRHGALAELALWPGTKQLKNPYFDMEQHAKHEQLFKDGLKECERDDQELGQTMVSYADQLPFAPLDASFIQSHGGWPFF